MASNSEGKRVLRFGKMRSDIRRIVLLGKTGSGKSSLANTIFGEKDLFKVCHSASSGTMFCQSETRSLQGRNIQLIDTPGLFDTDPNAPDFKKEILKCMIRCAEGIHTFLLVLKAERFTRHELSVAEVICQNFSDEVLKYTTVVFTQGDQIEEGVQIEEWLAENEALSVLIKKCGGRCHVFDNKYWVRSQDPYRNNQFQVRELLKTIDLTVQQNRGRCYTNANLQKVQEKLRQERAAIKSHAQHANEQQVEKIAEENTASFFWPFMASVSAVGALLGLVFLGRA